MNSQPNSYDRSLYLLLSAFYSALRSRRFDVAAVSIQQIETAVPDNPSAQSWAAYFKGILAEEHDRNWAEAERIYLKLLDSDIGPMLRGHVLLSLGVAYERQARWHESIQICSESAQLWSELGYRVKQAIVLRQMAISQLHGYEAGEFDADVLKQAEDYCQIALKTFDCYHKDSSELFFYEPDISLYQAMTLNTVGNIYRSMGLWQPATDAYQHMLAICSQRQDEFHQAFASWNLGNIFQLSDPTRWLDAEKLYQDALSVFQKYQDEFYECYVLAALSLLYLNMDQLDRANEMQDRALGLLDHIRLGVTSESARIGFFATVINIFDTAILTQLKTRTVPRMFDYMERACARSFLDSLAIGKANYAKFIDTKTLTLPELQQHLPPDTIMLKYYTTGLFKSHGGRMTEQQAVNNVLYPTPKTLLVAITWDDIAIYDLGFSPNTLFTANLEYLIEKYFLPSPLRKNLYTKLIAPIAHHLKNKRRLYIIPHGPLHYVPFHALIAPDGETLLREDGPEIVYAPSATILFRELQKPDRLPPGTCLAVGYNGDAGMELHFAEEEATYIARMAGGSALVGPSAKKAALYAQAPNFQALHFSCHGEFDPDSPLESLLHIGPGETLTGQEIMDNLHLKCNLVTLSACESGLSKVQRGDELYGLIRAFMYAGAPAIIATLWRVDERSTLIFAEKFYELEQQGVPYATAVKAAQLYLKNLTRKETLAILTHHLAQTAPADGASLLLQAQQYLKSFATREALQDGAHTAADLLPGADGDEKIFADPKYWAPFVLIGDPQIQRP